MTTGLDPEDIRRALWENQSAPNGLLRNARGEELVAAAESTGDPGLLRAALFGLIKAYEYSTERGKMMVPFARLLQEWDRDPSAFDAHDTHTLHWMFKWVSSGMLTLPEIPLATMERWLGEMENRYRTAGFTERAVRQAEFELAHDIGDTERAARAFASWTAADRDPMANCNACELNDQGTYWTTLEQDDKALHTWEPVLAGRARCAEEPHRVLAKSLLPLLRTGRPDEARAHHLRGYRMARGDESLLPSIGLHIEFCALTGNEGRGLEILAEHAPHLASDGNPWSRLELLGGTLVLLRRLLSLGLDAQPSVAFRGTGRTVRELHDLLDAEAAGIAARFDARNGSAVVSGRLKERLEREPLMDRLPLGVRAASLAPPAAAAETPPTAGGAPAAAAGTPVTGTPRAARAGRSLPELAAEARALRAAGHPAAQAAWDLAEAARDQLPETDPLLDADLLEHRAMRTARAGADDARELFERVVAAYRAAGEPSRAALNELRVTVAAARTGAEPSEVRRLLEAAASAARALDPADPTRKRRLATVALTRIRLAAALGHEQDEAHARLDERLASFVTEFSAATAAGHAPDDRHDAAEGRAPDDRHDTADGRVPDVEADALEDLIAEAEVMRATHAWQAGDPQAADALLASAAQRCVAAGRGWDAAEPLARRARLLMGLGRPAEAERSARAAVEHGAELVAPEDIGPIRLTLAEVLCQQQGQEAEAAVHALEAAHWFDAAGDTAGAGAYARFVLAQAYGESGRPAEAAEVLESALPDLLEHGDEQAVRARDVLGRCLSELGDRRAAAEQYLLAAEVAEDWEHPGPHARLATLAAESLAAAGMRDEAVAAYHRAVELWRTVGDPASLARALRSLAWLEAGAGDSRAAKDLMGRALTALDGDGPDGELLMERARTWSQTAELLLDEVYEAEEADEQDDTELNAVRHEAILLLERADTAFAGLGERFLDERVRCVRGIAWTERGAGRTAEGATRLRSLIAEFEALDTDEARSCLPGLRHALEQFTPDA
ncbi:tetratricopeptide repeat protein [Streptomyces sp. NPDC047886]|uniref:tetratricopeptide repeat protein n=1 Tax=Streptomyces sp. NPDC047886 TaxID=3365490 RepID=UPI003712B519